ncbi:MAG: calcium-binding protein, partial [Alphaproteobacteria bacterium]
IRHHNLTFIADAPFEAEFQFAANVGEFTVGGNADVDLLSGSGPQSFLGNAGENFISGGDGFDRITGGPGDDVLQGGAGKDVLNYDLERGPQGISGSINGKIVDTYGDTDFVSEFEFLFGSGRDDILFGSSEHESIHGFGGDDQIFGGGKNDNLTGGVGDDILDGGNGLDNLTGGPGDNVLRGGANDDSIGGGFGNDILFGGANSDKLSGGRGDDVLTGDHGTGRISGGSNHTDTGFDTVDYSVETGSRGVTVNLAGGLATDTFGKHDFLDGIDAVIATSRNDRITGDDNANTFVGGAGNDAIDGGLGQDTVDYSSEGGITGVTVDLATNTATDSFGDADSVQNVEIIIGTSLGDTLTGDGLANIFIGNAGADILDGGGDIDTVDYSREIGGGGIRANLLTGAATDTHGDADTLSNIERIVATAKDDVITGNRASDSFNGDAGDDVLRGANGDDVLDGGDGIDVLSGLNGNDDLTGGAGADRLFGQGDNDILTGGAGRDRLNGGAGNDTADYSRETGAGPISADLTTRTITDTFGDQDCVISIENVVGTGLNDMLLGDGVGNTLQGGDGNDVLIGGAGADAINGDAGTDTVDYGRETGGGGVDVDLLTGVATDSFGDIDALFGIETITGTAFGDTLSGDGGVNSLNGADGNDDVRGGAGDDQLSGGNDNDLLAGALGNDHLDGEAGRDRLFGQVGDDIMVGGAGNDAFFGGAGQDSIDYSQETGAGPVTANMINGRATDTFGNTDFFSEIEHITGSNLGDLLVGNGQGNSFAGSGGNDFIQGASGDDQISGDSSADVLVGGRGVDIMTGGGDGDFFRFILITDTDVDEENRDEIADFSSADGDILDLSRIDANANVAGNNAFTFVNAFANTAGQATIETAGPNLFLVSMDVNGDSVADGEIQVSAIAFDAGDLLL